MPSSFLQSILNSDPQSPHLVYRDPVQFKQETGFMDFLIPFSDPSHSPEGFEPCPELESGSLQPNDIDASVASGSPLHTPDMLDISSGPDDMSFGNDCSVEVDHVFINQISCFSDFSSALAINASPSNPPSPPEPSASQPRVDFNQECTLPMTRTDVIASPGPSRIQCQIFARNRPLILHCQPLDAEDWVECSGPVSFPKHSVEIAGWEPLGSDKYPLVNLDLSDWIPAAATAPSVVQGPEDESLKQLASRTSDVVSLEDNGPATTNVLSRSWGRRLTSNRQLPETRKRRRIDTAMSSQVQVTAKQDTALQEAIMRLVHEVPSISGDRQNPLASTEESGEASNATSFENNSVTQIEIPSYIFPQPSVARAITQRAAEEERQRSHAENLRLLDKQVTDEEAEEARRLVEEFLDIPDDSRTQMKGDERKEGARDVLMAAFNPSRLSSPVPPAGLNRGLRPFRSFLDYSTSTRRRALGRSRSDAQAGILAPVTGKPIEKTIDNHFGNAQAELGTHQSLQALPADRIPGLDTFPPMKRLFEESDALNGERDAKRVRAS